MATDSKYCWLLRQRSNTPEADYGPIWKKNTEKFDKDYERFGGDDLAMLKNIVANRRDYTVYDFDQKIYDHYINYLTTRKVDLDNLLDCAEEPDLIPNSIVGDYNGYRISNDLLRKFCYADLMENHECIPKQHHKIFEIGAGIGSLARVISRLKPNGCYIISDLPETLYYAHAYLSRVTEKPVFLADEKNITELLTDKIETNCFILVPCYLRDRIPKLNLDLLINTASLGEMTNSACLSWFSFIHRQRPNKVFLLNRYLNNWTLSNKVGNFSSISLDDQWDIMDWQLDPIFLQSQGEELEPNYLLVIARHQSCDDLKPDSLEANFHLENAEASFLAHRTLIYGSRMNRRYHRNLYSGIGGAFFSFWEACRLDNSQNSIYKHLAFLRAWGPADKPYEEIITYHALLLLKSNDFLWLLDDQRPWHGRLWVCTDEYGTKLFEVLTDMLGQSFLGVFSPEKILNFEIGPRDAILVRHNNWVNRKEITDNLLGRSQTFVMYENEHYENPIRIGPI